MNRRDFFGAATLISAFPLISFMNTTVSKEDAEKKAKEGYTIGEICKIRDAQQEGGAVTQELVALMFYLGIINEKGLLQGKHNDRWSGFMVSAYSVRCMIDESMVRNDSGRTY